ncbi:MAG: zinc ABC transporter substrate-binding protein [Oscillospiraceae bacterium]|nr:zinc ABC transporter substrate-binding protein [Oscillospiraceae bacterium]
MKRIVALLLCLLLLAGCAPAGQDEQQVQVNIVATTYPAYLAALTVTEGVDRVSVSRLDTGSVSCLHDYTLTVSDMKKLSRADVIVMNGAGMEDFMSDALATSTAAVIDCSEGVSLLPATGHHDHDHEHHDHDSHFDGHYWMDPIQMAAAVDAVLTGLLPLLGEGHAATLTYNASTAHLLLNQCYTSGLDAVQDLSAANAQLITFHDGFAYFAAAFGLPLLASIEEEAGSEASAKEIIHVTELVREYELPAIFTEVNGSDATARAISRETGCGVYALSTIMDGREPFADDLSPITPYIEAININLATIVGAFSPKEVE